MSNLFVVAEDDGTIVRRKTVTPGTPVIAALAGGIGIVIGAVGSGLVQHVLESSWAPHPYELLGYLAIPFGAARFLFSWRRAVMVANVAMCLLLAGYFSQMGNSIAAGVYLSMLLTTAIIALADDRLTSLGRSLLAMATVLVVMVMRPPVTVIEGLPVLAVLFVKIGEAVRLRSDRLGITVRVGCAANVACWTVYSLVGGYMPVFWVTVASAIGMVGGVVLHLRSGRNPGGPSSPNWRRGPSAFEPVKEAA
jgi:hypothetical protein